MQANAICLRLPFVGLVIAATAVPVELQPLNWAAVSLRFGLTDVVANVASYVLVGMLFASDGWRRAMMAAACLSLAAEASQLVMLHRVASLADVTTNLSGAMIGVFIRRHWQRETLLLEMNRKRGFAAGAAALALLLGMWARADVPVNPRGATETGGLEAHWRFDEPGGTRAVDSAGRQHNGRLGSEVQRGPGVLGGAVAFNGRGNQIDCGHASTFRLSGSMTISAWIRSAAFPADDAAAVSTLTVESGYQLDTTIDRGPRTIGFKLHDPCGEYMSRYGATPLALGVWYHIAGVYDAEKQSLDVYLNGVLDNGPLRGSVSAAQRSSRERLCIGRRGSRRGYEFSGSIDDVRIYSHALSKAEIAAIMNGATVSSPAPLPQNAKAAQTTRQSVYWSKKNEPCGGISDREDASIPAAAGVLGVLVALALIGLFPAVNMPLLVAAALGAGSVLFALTGSNLPGFNLWLVPLTSLLCAASVTVSRGRPLR